MQQIILSLMYVMQGNLFWQSMGMTTATAIFIGAFLYHGTEHSSFYKAVYTVIMYSFFLIFTAGARVNPNISMGIINEKTYAAVITTIIITIAYVIGLLIGYAIVRKNKYR